MSEPTPHYPHEETWLQILRSLMRSGTVTIDEAEQWRKAERANAKSDVLEQVTQVIQDEGFTTIEGGWDYVVSATELRCVIEAHEVIESDGT